MDSELKKISKFLSLVLRHRPETIGLKLDENGWANIDQLLNLAKNSRRCIDRKQLERAVRENDKQRFTISDDRLRIRANQGHSLKNVDLQLQAVEPPSTLYHGTVERFLRSIREGGLSKQNRQHVHLSADIATAIRVGSRRGKPVILSIDATRMHNDGHVFYLSSNHVWLTDSVPVEYISFRGLNGD